VDNDLKKSLEIIKARAQRLRHRRKSDGQLDDEAGISVTPARPGETQIPLAPLASTAADPLTAYKIGEPKSLEEIQPGEARAVDGQSFYLIRSAGSAVDPHSAREAEAYAHLSAWPRYVECKPFGVTPLRRAIRKTAPFDRDAICFLDIETTGLSPNTYVFLCGIMFFHNSEFVVEQAFARDYAEEAGLLGYVRETLDRFEAVVTYNGVKFDLPFIKTRMAVNRIPVFKPFASVDLLYTARRVYTGILPNCKLGTVEGHLRGVERTGDIPGKHIPAAYHDYVHSGDGRAMKHVLYHNRMDLFTMAVFINRLADNETERA
jgi:uncharacterized protein YprB with RNaseH-like and TPR domain